VDHELQSALLTIVSHEPAREMLEAAVAAESAALQKKQADAVRVVASKLDERNAHLLNSVETRLQSVRQRFVAMHAVWAAPSDALELLSALFPDADVQLRTVLDAAGDVYGWSTPLELPLVRARAGGAGGDVNAKHRLPDDGRPMVGVCARAARFAHIAVAVRAARLFDAAPLIVTCDCVDDASAAAKSAGVTVIVV
jgi:hypothetical protein